jgi:UDP-N-acetylmuramoyl-tripeptide--D-alanyl-D-alanine ligase
MQEWSPEDIARAAGARLISSPASQTGPETVVIDSRQAGPGVLFVGLKGANEDGGRFAAQALQNGAWGVLTTEEHAAQAHASAPTKPVLATPDPLKSLQTLATAWRRHLNPHVIGVTGSTGKTSTKDLLNAVITPHRRTVASRANFNTEIGVPLEILGAPQGTEVLILEMAMRGRGQIKELADIAEPDIGIIVSIGPVHLELLGSIEAIAATKAELIAALPSTGTAIIPADEPLLHPHIRADLRTVTFGPTGDVRLAHATDTHVTIDTRDQAIELDVPFTQAHLRTNLLAAVAAAQAIGVTPTGHVELVLSAGRGQRIALPNDVLLIDDCYNANPMSMRAALADLAATANNRGRPTRRVAVLGDMLELGPDERRFHEEIGNEAHRHNVDLLITVGPLAAAMTDTFAPQNAAHSTQTAPEAAALAQQLLQPGDTVLVKASRGVGLELVCGALQTAEALA